MLEACEINGDDVRLPLSCGENRPMASQRSPKTGQLNCAAPRSAWGSSARHVIWREGDFSFPICSSRGRALLHLEREELELSPTLDLYHSGARESPGVRRSNPKDIRSFGERNPDI
jgi:hypothetical protein